MLCRGDDGRFRRIRDHDPTTRGGIDIDVVDAHPGSADHLQAVGPLEHVSRQLRRRADHDRVIDTDLVGEVAVRLDVDLEALAQELDASLGDWLA